ncbi:protein of unknown function [Cyanobium sp. NIES-981]|nr:protein of unknown function [Cyanobium sp. NIES-981]
MQQDHNPDRLNCHGGFYPVEAFATLLASLGDRTWDRDMIMRLRRGASGIKHKCYEVLFRTLHTPL